MNIATALNRKYVNYTIVMLTSLCINNPSHIDAYLMYNDLTDKDISVMRKNLYNYDIDIIPVYVARENLPDNLITSEMWSIETYFRLLMIELLPESVDRILYLDVDLIINKNISALYNIDLDNNLICAALDTNGTDKDFKGYSELQQQMFSPFLKNGFMYFNAGVMLYDMESIRKIYNFGTYLDAMKKWNFEMPANDQDILNYVYHDSVLYIPWEKYNLSTYLAHIDGMTKNDAENVPILHFATFKPWSTSYIHYDIEGIWWDYAKKTPVYHAIADQYVTQMTEDNTLENYNKGLLQQISEQKNTINSLIRASQELIEKLK